MKPTCDAVIAAVVRGRVVRLSPDDEQKRALRDHDGQLALHVLRHALAARTASVDPGGPPEPFPLVGHFTRAVAHALGHHVGIKRAYVLRRRLVAARVIEESGSYRPHYTNRAGSGAHRVTLYRLAVGVVGYVRRRERCASHKAVASVGRPSGVKQVRAQVRWWQTPFAGPDGKPPPGVSMARARRMRSLDELETACR